MDKTQTRKEKKERKKRKVEMTKEQEKLWTEFSNDFHYEITGRLLVFNDHLWEVPELAPFSRWFESHAYRFAFRRFQKESI